MHTVRSPDGTAIAYEVVGTGPTLIVVGGALSTRAAPASLAASLSDGFTVITYDRRGRGDSGDTPPYAPEREMEDLRAVLDANGGRGFVFGHSSGAILSLKATAAGLPVDRLVVYEPPFILPGSRDYPPDLMGRIQALVGEGAGDDAVRLFLIEAVQLPPGVVDAMAGSPAWPAMQAIAPTLAYDLAISDGGVLGRDQMGRIAVPTLALSGGDSPAWMRDGVRAVADAVPGAVHRSLPGQTHGAADDVLGPALREFLLG